MSPQAFPNWATGKPGLPSERKVRHRARRAKLEQSEVSRAGVDLLVRGITLWGDTGGGEWGTGTTYRLTYEDPPEGIHAVDVPRYPTGVAGMVSSEKEGSGNIRGSARGGCGRVRG